MRAHGESRCIEGGRSGRIQSSATKRLGSVKEGDQTRGHTTAGVRLHHAVNATCAPVTAVAGAAVSVVVVGVPAAMVSVTVAELEAALPVSPPYCAVTLYAPAASVLLVNVAVPVPSSVPVLMLWCH